MKKKEADMTIADHIKQFDFYKDLPQDLQEPSVSGASVSMIAMGLMALLFLSRTYDFMQVNKVSEVVIDANTQSITKLNINMNITMHRAPCHILSLDIVDVTGVHVVDVQGRLHKHRIDKDGHYIELHDLMNDGADFQNANSNMDDIYRETIKAMDDQEGCLVEGTVIINKVPGNFHLSTHAFGQVVYMIYNNGRQLDFSHTIHHLSFGNDTQMKQIQSRFGEKFTFDLDGHHINQQQWLYQGQILANYYLDINQVDYFDQTGPVYSILEGYKHRTSKSILAQMGAPAIFFRYELSPIKVRYTMSYTKWSQFMIDVCAIVGGLFTVAGIIESVLRNGIGMFSAGGSDDNKKGGRIH